MFNGSGAASLLSAAFLAWGTLRVDAATAAKSTAAFAPVAASMEAAASRRAFFDAYCVTCHNTKLKTAGLTLDTIDGADVPGQAETWEKVIRKLRSGAMPPLGARKPDRALALRVSDGLVEQLDREAVRMPNPGRPAVHRLNRAEYTNAIRDLLALDVDGPSLLPTDESGYGFDNIADVLSLSPGLMERYLSAARKISGLAVGDVHSRPVIQSYGVTEMLLQSDRMSDELPFGSRGGMAIRHNFPVDADYVIRVRLRRGGLVRDVISGLGTKEQIDVRIDDRRVTVFTIGGEYVGVVARNQNNQTDSATAEQVAYEQYRHDADSKLNIRVHVPAGPRVLGVSFLKRGAPKTEGVGLDHLPVLSTSFSSDAALEQSVEHVEIEGPFDVVGPGDTPSRRQVFVCTPQADAEERACARQILTRLAKRAYRRPLTAGDVGSLMKAYDTGRDDADFAAGVRFALERILVSPDFLFRVELDPAGAVSGRAYRITDLELASRLSFFLWSTVPDDTLLDLAIRGRLREPAVLEQQVKRMLADRRLNALVVNFGGQWLRLRNMKGVAPDSRLFPEFDTNLREAFQRETELFLESQLREDRSVLDLLTANYTFLNERLARHYGIPNVYGSHFRRVELSDDRRWGVLGQGSVLTVTSYSTRTSPVVRGKWLLENFLGAPPPPPPPNVPALADAGDAGAPASVRERLEQHRRNPVCASCHAQMDPLGFALENFDALGKWRTVEGHTAIDATGVLPDGTRFSGPVEFRKILLARQDEFVGTVAEKLLTYALGRGVEYYDMPAVRTIARKSQASGYSWSSIILGIVRSTPFQMRAVSAQ
jgi:mono/diheme cytochrome c family protein